MPNGIRVYGTGGEIKFDSPTISSNFFDLALNATVTTNFGSSEFSSAGAIATPLGVMTITMDYNSSTWFKFNLAGCVSTSGSTYYRPTAHLLQGVLYPYAVGTALASQILRFGQLTNGATGYGFTCEASDGTLAISQTAKAFYIHPNSAGSRLRTATATSNATALSVGDGPVSSYTQSLSQTITFDYPMNNPPLIFITQSDGYIALNGMIRDGNGKYIGASICTSPTITMWGGFGGQGAVSPVSHSFTYFIVSSDIPMYGGGNTHGLEVFNGAGTKVFSSSHFIPSIQKTSVALPYFWMSGTYTAATWTYTNTSTLTKTAAQGVCINSFHAMTSATGYATFGNESGNMTQGILTVAGRYISVGQTTVVCKGMPTSSLFVVAPAMMNVPESWDFNLGNTATLPVFFANSSY